MSLNCSTVQDVTTAIAENSIEFVDLKFTDFTVSGSISRCRSICTTRTISSRRAWASMAPRSAASSRSRAATCCWCATRPRPLSTRLRAPDLSVIANVYEPGTMEAFARDPRNVIRRAEAYLKETGIADTMYCGPEAEFFIFDQVMYETGRYSSAMASRAARRSGPPASGGRGTRSATRAATFRWRRSTSSRTSARRWSTR
jgi:glutamine synthetase